MLTKINNYYDKKTKFKKDSQFEELKIYLHNKKSIDHHISFGKYQFVYKNYLVNNIRPENIFKLNWKYIIDNMKTYFPDINYTLKYEEPSIMQKKLIKNNSKYKHDIYIYLEYNDKIYDFAIEYDEEEHNKTLNLKIKDDIKEIKSKIFTDKYLVYSEPDDIELFMKDAIYNILLYSCSISEDIYNMVRINFFKLNKYSKDLEDALDEIIYLLNNKTTDFHLWANKLLIKNKKTKKLFTTEELIEYLDEKYDVAPIFTNPNTWECETKSIEEIINALPKNFNTKIDNYKTIHQKAIKMCIDSYDQIYKLIDEKNENTKKYLLPFLDNFVKFELQDYTNSETIKKFLENVIIKKYNKNKNIKNKINEYIFAPCIINLLKIKKILQ